MSNQEWCRSVSDIIELGFTEIDAVNALNKHNKNVENAINYLLQSSLYGNKEGQQQTNIFYDQQNIMNGAFQQGVCMDPLTPNLRQRLKNLPVGIMNIGNTCYMNSILQLYFSLPSFVSHILSSKTSQTPTLVHQLQLLFVRMIKTNQKYVNPGQVLIKLQDQSQNDLSLGVQRDMNEFNQLLLETIEEELKEKPKQINNQQLNVVMQNNFLEESSLSESIIIDKQFNNAIQGKQEFQQLEWQGGTLFNLFYGEQIEMNNIQNKTNSFNQKDSKKGVFGGIILNIENFDQLLIAWEESLKVKVDDYQFNQIDHDFMKKTWYLRCPDVMVFQLQRVYYDIGLQRSVKTNKKFTFDKEIYPDRFMMKNMQKCIDIKDNIRNLRKQLYELKYNKQLITKTEDPVQLLNDSADLMDLIDSKLAQQIRESIGKIKIQLQEIDDQILKIEQKIKLCFKEIDKTKYVLHAIFIHEGTDSSQGHYYAFIHDHVQKQWFKYSDHHVSSIDEERVMEISFGGQKYTSSAYCLCYINKVERMNIDNFPNMFFNQVMNENKEFSQLVLQQQPLSIDKIVKEIDEIKQLIKQDQQLYQKEYILISFNHYIYNHKSANENIKQQVMLDIAIRKLHPEHIRLCQINEEDSLLNQLKSKYSKEVFQQYDKIDEWRQHYMQAVKNAIMTFFILQNLDENFFEEAMKVLSNEKQTTDQDQFKEYKKMHKDSNRVFILYLTSQINKALFNKQYDHALKLGRLLVSDANQFLDETDIHYKQARNNLSSTCRIFSMIIPESYFSQLESIRIDLQQRRVIQQTSHSLPTKLEDQIASTMMKIETKPDFYDRNLAKTYEDNMKSFMTKLEPWIGMHKKIFNGKLFSEKEMYDLESNAINIDIRRVN